MTALRPARSWRFVVTGLNGASITMLDALASNRVVTPMLGGPLTVTGDVPSDDPQVNILHDDGFPFLAEGVRQLYCFREEDDAPPYFNVRASTLLLQVNDAASTGEPTTRFTGFDPWQYMMSRPVLVSPVTVNDAKGNALPGSVTQGDLIPDVGISYPDTMTADEIVQDMVANTVFFADTSAPLAAQQLFVDYGQFGSGSTNVVETCQQFPAPGWPIQQGTSLGQALKDLMASGVLDIVLIPIYDSARPGILTTLDIYSQDLANGVIGFGSYNYSAPFAWDRPGRSVVGIDNMFDGTERANVIQFYSGQGGPPVPRISDANSIAIRGEYWAQQFFPATQENLPAVVAFSEMQLALRKDVKQTLTVNPAPVRAPEPYVDYYIGDAVPDWSSNRLRQALPPETVAQANALNSATVNVASTGQWPEAGTFLIAGHEVTYTGKTATSFTGCSAHAATASGDIITTTAWQRVYGIPTEIDDNGMETVRELIVGIVGAPL